ncbi:MAG TPA: methyltransferase domain-containing protein [Flavitalea sp.]|nr:methyltransferase domain-containing protein [Flavitalea sp.]
MNIFTQRSARTELIDQPGIPFEDWKVCLHELNNVNTYLGGHNITIEGVKYFLTADSTVQKKITICEVGCGGGDNLKAVNRWYKRTNKNQSLQFIGVDINQACTDFAKKSCNDVNALFICSDYRDVKFNDRPDIIYNSLFCHHFTNNQLIEMLRWMKKNAAKGFFINDLQRHPIAYYSIKWLTKLFSHSYLVKNDGPVSVLRGFHKKDWVQLLNEAGITNYIIHWRWAFRYLVIVKNE